MVVAYVRYRLVFAVAIVIASGSGCSARTRSDERFMVFSGVLDVERAHRRFDGMLERAAELPFAKQPVIERRTGSIIGYSGVNSFEFEEQRRLEYGYRLVPEARGRGYATEAGRALLTPAEETFSGEILAMIGPRNVPSQKVARKLGFAFWKQAIVDGLLANLYRLHVGTATAS